jgi:hypothetical protein
MIRRRLSLALLALLLLAEPATTPRAAAAEAAPKPVVGQFVDLQPVGMPIVVDGELMAYVFVYVRLNLTAGADVSRWRAKEPFFRDILVRTGHQTPFTVPGDFDHIDVAKLSAAMMRRASVITGPGVIQSVVVMRQVSSRPRHFPHV